MHVLVVSDDTPEVGSLIHQLGRHGYDIVRVNTGKEALLAYDSVDLILIDCELPDIDGVEVCRHIRSASDVPIIVVTSRDGELDRVLGLQAGSDDYVVHPFGFRELLARMEAVMRRVRSRSSRLDAAAVVYGSLLIDPLRRQVRLRGRPLKVTRKEFDLLHLLARNPEQVVSRRQITAEVWAGQVAETSRTVDTHVNSLRNKLGARTSIVTVHGIGFRMGDG